MDAEAIYERMSSNTDQDSTSIYWGKRFYKRFFGAVGKEVFKVRPVVPYWNISPVEIRGRVSKGKGDQHVVECRMTCPYLRVVVPLVVLAVVLFFINYGLMGEAGTFLNVSGVILAVAYLLVNLPFQIQASRNLKTLRDQLEGEILELR